MLKSSKNLGLDGMWYVNLRTGLSACVFYSSFKRGNTILHQASFSSLFSCTRDFFHSMLALAEECCLKGLETDKT